MNIPRNSRMIMLRCLCCLRVYEGPANISLPVSIEATGYISMKNKDSAHVKIAPSAVTKYLFQRTIFPEAWIIRILPKTLFSLDH